MTAFDYDATDWDGGLGGEGRLRVADPLPVTTRKGLRAHLADLGLAAGDAVILHTSLQSMGLVIGGPRTVIEAVLDVIGPGGTLMMPAFSGDLSNPADWRHPAVPGDLINEVRAEIPHYDPQRTPTRRVGAVAEYFRTYPGALRSPHPQSSFCAYGRAAAFLTAQHPLSNRFSATSPLGRLLDLGGKVLMLGAPLDTCTALYLPLYNRAGQAVAREYPVDGAWRAAEDIALSTAHMAPLIRRLIERGQARSLPLGKGDSIVFAIKDAAAAYGDGA